MSNKVISYYNTYSSAVLLKPLPLPFLSWSRCRTYCFSRAVALTGFLCAQTAPRGQWRLFSLSLLTLPSPTRIRLYPHLTFPLQHLPFPLHTVLLTSSTYWLEFLSWCFLGLSVTSATSLCSVNPLMFSPPPVYYLWFCGHNRKRLSSVADSYCAAAGIILWSLGKWCSTMGFGCNKMFH